MAIALVVNTIKGGTSGGVTTTGVNTTGADLIVISVPRDNGTTIAAADISDSVNGGAGNTWTALTDQNTTTPACRLYYTYPTNVGINHTFTATKASSFPVLAVLAFSGTLSSGFDVQNGNSSGGGNTLSTGSITPSVDNEVLVAALAYDDTSTVSVNSSFTIPASNGQIGFAGGAHYGGAIAYQIQTTATTRNPTFSWTTAGTPSANIASFKAAAGGFTAVNRRSLGARVGARSTY